MARASTTPATPDMPRSADWLHPPNRPSLGGPADLLARLHIGVLVALRVVLDRPCGALGERRGERADDRPGLEQALVGGLVGGAEADDDGERRAILGLAAHAHV